MLSKKRLVSTDNEFYFIPSHRSQNNFQDVRKYFLLFNNYLVSVLTNEQFPRFLPNSSERNWLAFLRIHVVITFPTNRSKNSASIWYTVSFLPYWPILSEGYYWIIHSDLCLQKQNLLCVLPGEVSACLDCNISIYVYTLFWETNHRSLLTDCLCWSNCLWSLNCRLTLC